MKNEKLNTINKTGFKTPDNYFESFNERVFNKLNQKLTIENIEGSGFSIPDNYFKTVESTILKATQNESKTKIVSLFSRKNLYYFSGIAASIILLFSIFVNKEETELFTAETVENYLAEADLDSYDLAQLLIQTNVLEDNFSLTGIENTDENLETYLLENADIETMIE